jgi:hypothetical protein
VRGNFKEVVVEEEEDATSVSSRMIPVDDDIDGCFPTAGRRKVKADVVAVAVVTTTTTITTTKRKYSVGTILNVWMLLLSQTWTTKMRFFQWYPKS